jgi:hypothetical protein
MRKRDFSSDVPWGQHFLKLIGLRCHLSSMSQGLSTAYYIPDNATVCGVRLTKQLILFGDC